MRVHFAEDVVATAIAPVRYQSDGESTTTTPFALSIKPAFAFREGTGSRVPLSPQTGSRPERVPFTMTQMLVQSLDLPPPAFAVTVEDTGTNVTFLP